MSGASSSAVEWFTRLEPAKAPDDLPHRPDDPRLGEVVEFWRGEPDALRPGRAVLIGFPQDEGVRRNGGRVGAAEAPDEIRRWLHRLTTGDPALQRDLTAAPPLDVGNVRIAGDLEQSQEALAAVVAAVVGSGAVPVILGGGHETTYGVFLGYVAAGLAVGIVNIDAHLDVRPLIDGRGHSGSPFRQALDHAPPLARYVCMGAQPHVTSGEHLRYVSEHGGRVHWHREVEVRPSTCLNAEVQHLSNEGLSVHVTIDADVVRQADVPGVSAPNPIGIEGRWLMDAARIAGLSPQVAGLDLVEINPRHDRDGQSARWGALVVWNFLVGLLDRT
jgi:formiminoglutamase